MRCSAIWCIGAVSSALLRRDETAVTFAVRSSCVGETAVTFARPKCVFLWHCGRAKVSLVSCVPVKELAKAVAVSFVREKVRPAALCHRESAKKFALRAQNTQNLAFLCLLGEFFRGRAAGGAVLGEYFRADWRCAQVLLATRCTSGGCGGGFAPCEALCRRVAGVSEPWMASFPPVGGGATATSGGVAAKVQTHWTKVAENGLFWLNGSVLWRICCLSWCVVRTRTRYCEPKPAISHVNPLLRV